MGLKFNMGWKNCLKNGRNGLAFVFVIKHHCNADSSITNRGPSVYEAQICTNRGPSVMRPRLVQIEIIVS